MLVLGDTAVSATGRACEALFLERGQGLAHCIFIQIHDRIAVVFLVAGVDQRVQRKRIIIRSSDIFFHQGAEHSGFDFIQDYFHSVSPPEMAGTLQIVQKLWSLQLE
jgi:hypothetical protein